MEPMRSSSNIGTNQSHHKHVVLKAIVILIFFFFLSLIIFSVLMVDYYTPCHNNNSNNNNDDIIFIGDGEAHKKLWAVPFPEEASPTKSGYIPTLSTHNSMFYAFYEAQSTHEENYSCVPIIVWLQGGPGCSSMYGNFLEVGPWRLTGVVDHDHDHRGGNQSQGLFLESNPGAWNRLFGVLFLDNPLGSGFSVTADPTVIPSDHHIVAKHLYAVISRFLDLEPGFRSRTIFIAGESYAGKYIPAVAHHIVMKNAEHHRSRVIRLGGVAIGNGLVDALTQVSSHAAVAYYSGLINERQRKELEALQSEAARLAVEHRWSEAADARYKVVDVLQAMTGLATLFDFTKKRQYPITVATEFLNDRSVKAGLRADEKASFGGCSQAVHVALHGDTMRSVKYSVEFLLRSKSVKVLLYQGMYDLWDGVVSTEAWIKTMSSWNGTEKFLESERRVWRDPGGDVAGYVQRYVNLSNVVVFGAGHLVPVDQPVNARVMIENWVLDRGMFDNTVQVSAFD